MTRLRRGDGATAALRRASSPVTLILVAMLVLSGLSGPAFAGDDYEVLADYSVAGADAVDSDPYGVALHPSLPFGYVCHAGSPAFADPEFFNGSTVSEIDLETGEIVRSFEVGLFPTDVAVTSDGGSLFVAVSTSGTIAKIDLVSGDVVEAPLVDSFGMPVSYPSSIVLSPDESQVWVSSNGGSFDGSNENLIVIDRASLEFLDSVTIVGSLSRFVVRADGVAVVPIGFPDDVFPSQPRIAIYDTTVVGWSELASLTLDVDITDFPAPADVALREDGSEAFVAVLGGSNEVHRVDVDTMQLQAPIEMPSPDFFQHGLAIVGDTLVVTDFNASQARVVDTATDTVIATIPTGAQPNEVVIGGGRLWITGQLDEVVTVAALPGAFSRGDANLDERIDVADGVAVLDALFVGGTLGCEDAADINDDGGVDLADPITLFDYLFGDGAPPAYPFLLPGRDYTPDALDCDLR